RKPPPSRRSRLSFPLSCFCSSTTCSGAAAAASPFSPGTASMTSSTITAGNPNGPALPAARPPAAAPGKGIRIAVEEPPWLRRLLIASAAACMGVILITPLAAVFHEAFRKGVPAYFAAISSPDTLAAIRLTLLACAIAVPLNVLFGVAAAWAIAKFDFKGKNFLITLIDLPFSVSPVVSGLVFVLLFGAQGYFGEYLQDRNIDIVFAVPGIVLAT